MAPIAPPSITHWIRAILDDVAFITYIMTDEMNAYDICAVLRHNYPYQRYIRPSDVATIQEWLADKEEGHGGLKEAVKHTIWSLGETKTDRWRDGVLHSLRTAKRMGWYGFDLFEDEDPRPRGEIEVLAEQLGGLAVGEEATPIGPEPGEVRVEEEVEEEPKEAAEPIKVQKGWKILSRSDDRHEKVEGILREVAAGTAGIVEGEPSDEKVPKE